jgi:hypothetical protein
MQVLFRKQTGGNQDMQDNLPQPPNPEQPDSSQADGTPTESTTPATSPESSRPDPDTTASASGPKAMGATPPPPAAASAQTEASVWVFVGQVIQTLKKTWASVQPVLRSQTIRLLNVLIPALQKLIAPLAEQAMTADAAVKSRVTQPTATAAASTEFTERATQAVKKGWLYAKPVLLDLGVRLLQLVIWACEQLLKWLEPTAAEQANGVNAATSVKSAPTLPLDPLLATTQETIQPAVQQVRPVLDKVPPALNQLSMRWPPILTKIRDRLPEPVNREFSDRGLTSTLVVSVVMLFWFLTSLTSPGQSTEVASKSATKPTPTATLVSPPSRTAPVATKPSPSATKLVSPPVQTPVATKPTPVPTLAPTLVSEKSPEQVQLEKIQTQMTAIASQYTDTLLQSVSQNLGSSRLTVDISDDWYTLNPARQDQLADAMLQRSHDLSFKAFEIRDSHRQIVARSPVVGDQVIILKRKLEIG